MLCKCSSSGKKIALYWLWSTGLQSFSHSAMLLGLLPLVLHTKGARTSNRRPISTSNGPAPLRKLFLLVCASSDRRLHEIDGWVSACVIITTALECEPYPAVRSPGSTVRGACKPQGALYCDIAYQCHTRGICAVGLGRREPSDDIDGLTRITLRGPVRRRHWWRSLGLPEKGCCSVSRLNGMPLIFCLSFPLSK